ncbi:MAG TPA: SMP-30/gluconolactonase/LRE family protein [Gemmatimonadaceae bacterium]
MSSRFVLAALALVACGRAPSPAPAARDARSPDDAHRRLPTGVRLDPAGHSVGVGQMPLAMTLSPDGTRVLLLLGGWREQGLQVVDRATGGVLQTLAQPSAFLGLAFAPGADALWTSGGNTDAVYRYAWKDGAAALADSIPLAPRPADRHSGVRYPAGLALSPDGRTLYVAENLADSLAVVDVASHTVVQRLPTERYPYGVAVAPDGTVYVSAWGGWTVSVFHPARDGRLADGGRIRVGRHPSALLLGAGGSRLFVASGSTDRVMVVDTRRRQVVATLLDPPPAGPTEGSTPNALALSPDGTRLFVAEGDANAIAVFDLAPLTAGVRAAHGDDRLAGRIPVEWYPTAVAASGDTLLVANGKGRGTAPNPGGPNPLRGSGSVPRQYTLGQVEGTLSTIAPSGVSGAALASLTARVARADRWTAERTAPSYPPFEHVVYIIKENRTYDQVLGDLPQGDGDTSLVFFPRRVSPNHHALAERFGIFDRFFVNAEVSADGHNWSTAAYATDYLEKTVPSQYSGRGRSYDYEGTNRGWEAVPDDDVTEPASGYLWDLANRAGITFRNYGEFVVKDDDRDAPDLPAGYRGDKPYLASHTERGYPGFDLGIPDQRRADIWIERLHADERAGTMPQLEIVRLPNDHTAGARAGEPTPRAYMADNDLALGRMIDALSRSRFWRSTVVFVLEDDAQNGPDHVDSHRSPMLVISPYSRGGVIHRFANTTDVIATIAEILHLGSLSQFDYYGRPLRDVFADTPDLAPYTAIAPSIALDERNPARGAGASASARLDLRFEDRIDDDVFNRILWVAIKGADVPYPGATRMSALEARRSR